MDLQKTIAELRTQNPAELAAAASTHLPFWVSALLVVLIAYYLARLVWITVPTETSYDWTQRPITAGSTAQTSAATINYKAIVAAHLFGKANEEPVEVVEAPGDGPCNEGDCPDTRLNLKLRGTIATDDETVAHAIIADGSGKAEVYFVKDPVPGGAALHEVHPDKVILKRGGVFETLRLPKVSEGGATTVARRPTPTRPPNAGTARSGVTSLPQALASEPGNFTDVLRPQPFMPNGQLRGYRVYPGRDRRSFAALGLRPGDLVTEINGTLLDDLSDGMEIFRNLGDTTQLTLTVERNGQSLVLTLDTSQLDGG